MKNVSFLLIPIFFLIIQSCSNSNSQSKIETDNKIEKKPEVEKKSKAQLIIDKAINFHGGNNYLHSEVNFDFRDKHYSVTRRNGLYTYTRSFNNEKGEQVFDMLDNNRFERQINNLAVTLTDEWIGKYSRSVNSVAYFTMLPYGLNDPAVQKELLGEVTIKNKSYYKLKISFNEEGGGEDHEDVFIYWVDKKNYKIDYLAYSYHTDGGGKRFRSAYNDKRINGIIFQDYVNYKELDQTTSIESYDRLFEEGKLKELSRIENKNIKVKIIN